MKSDPIGWLVKRFAVLLVCMLVVFAVVELAKELGF